MGNHGSQRERADTIGECGQKIPVCHEVNGISSRHRTVRRRNGCDPPVFVFCSNVPQRLVIGTPLAARETPHGPDGRCRRQTACKPGSVRALRRGATIPLGRASLRASRDLPGRRGGNAPASQAGMPRSAAGRPYSVLLPVGFTLPPLLPVARCALAAPFHPCRRAAEAVRRRFVFCGTVPGVAPAGR
jgi:hypothetical protein